MAKCINLLVTFNPISIDVSDVYKSAQGPRTSNDAW